MQGRRIESAFPTPLLPPQVEPGDYWKDAQGYWRGMTPNGLFVFLKGHDIAEHDDGTITAKPSILASNGNLSWHGFLERGVWREC